MRAKILSFSLLFALLFALLVPSAGAAYPGAPAVRATSALFLNIDSGAVLLSQNTDAEIDPGSLVKLMTGLLVVENVKDLEGTVTVSETAIQGLDGLTTSSLQPGEEMTARDLLCCALIYSSADACNALAEHSAGSIDQFVKMMNEKAKALGMEHTVFVNTHGGPAEGQVSTVDDLQKLALYVLQNKTLTNICDTSYKTILPTNKNDKKRYYYNKMCIRDSAYTARPPRRPHGHIREDAAPSAPSESRPPAPGSGRTPPPERAPAAARLRYRRAAQLRSPD